MKKYIINAPEVWYVEYAIEANTQQEAFDTLQQMIKDGELPEAINREFSHIMQNASWDIREDA